MKPAKYFERRDNKKVQCTLCPHMCIIENNSRGICGVRENQGGELISLIYARPSAMNIDPIEKKPLFHFLPGSKTFSIGTVGCNMTCDHCQNHTLSRGSPNVGGNLLPKRAVELAEENGCRSISYTYNEPTIFYEYMLDTAMMARDEGLKNVIVSNGYMNKEPLAELLPYIDAANIDLKSFSDDFYRKICGARLDLVLETIKTIHKSCHLEITTLVIPGLNDGQDEIRKLTGWIASELGSDVPFHLSRFFPHHRMEHFEPTSKDTLLMCLDAAKENLKHVYLGNIRIEKTENTYCPSCNKLLIGRTGFGILINKIKEGRCPCGKKINGIFTS
ncbi:AmmeMemoRadiSam system radical SAM enzyme [Candidatus Woesearchaeota archaeon CG11_big_fil_rev_8_21_14_0_20_43_8]|nr:MAG: AmmeMemoRadiSam system radical SAM enzyme [Candidatus Woesearchaeota archaeon CG11_big_fil_rev_8_21_14_0_20_43_8]